VSEAVAERAPLPTGTVTFLFSDIEGSTQRWEQHRDEMKTAVAWHDTIVRKAVEAKRHSTRREPSSTRIGRKSAA
jgi:class 3 adenylate cyclase